MSRTLAMLAIAALAIGSPALSACSPAAHGLGDTAAGWSARHDRGVTPIVDARGLVDGYTATFTPTPLSNAVANVRAQLPPDATATPARLVEGIEGTKCEIVEFTSASLGRILGGRDGSHVLAVFETSAATSMDTTRISQVTVVSANDNIRYGC
jgi:hypothetical protein